MADQYPAEHRDNTTSCLVFGARSAAQSLAVLWLHAGCRDRDKISVAQWHHQGIFCACKKHRVVLRNHSKRATVPESSEMWYNMFVECVHIDWLNFGSNNF